MNRPVFSHLLALLLLLNSPSSASAQITGQQIKEAVDDGGDYDLAIETEPGSTLALIEDANAAGNQILEATVPHAENFKLTCSGIQAPAIIQFRYKLESNPNSPLQYETGPYQSRYEVNGETDEAGWTHATLLHYAHSGTDSSLLLKAGSSYDEDKSNRKLLLDHLKVTPGYFIETNADPGLTIEKYPDQLTYASDQSVLLIASPTEDNVEFLAWTDIHIPTVTTATRTITVDGHETIQAAAAKRYEFQGGNWLIPTSDLTHEVVSSPDEPLRLELKKESNSSKPIYLSANGPGFLSITCRRLSNTSSSFYPSGTLADDPVTQKIYIPQSVSKLPIQFKGHIEISQIEILEETYATIETVGNGSITGLEPDGSYQLGQTMQVTAAPDEGWYFEGWTGDVESTNPSLEIALHNPIKLTAVFYKKTEMGNIKIRQYDDHPWIVSETEIQSGFTLADGETSSLAWELEGPGVLEMTTQDSGYDFFLRISGTDEVLDIRDSDATERSIFIPAGTRLLTLFELDPSTYNRTTEVSISDLNWIPGIPLSLNTSIGGTIASETNGTKVVSYNTPVQLEAVPENGYQFYKWEGASESQQTAITLQLEFPSELRAIFRKSVEDDPWVTSLQGDKLWEFSTESGWKTPDTLEPGQKALLNGVLTGPAYLRFEVTGQSHDDLTICVDGGAHQSVTSSIELTAGPHSITIKDEQRYGRTEPSYLKLIQQYPVSIVVEAGDLQSTPWLQWHSGDQKQYGFITEGETLTFSMLNAEGFEFSHWEGDLAGKAQSDSITITGPIDAIARSQLKPLITGGLTWTTQPPENAYATQDQHLYPFGETTFTTDVTGPGWLSFRIFEDSQCTSVQLDGEALPPSSVDRELAEWQIPISEGNHQISIFRPEAGTPNSLCQNSSVRYIRFADGYHLKTGGYGGTVTLSPNGGVYEKGTNVSVAATPNEGNRFVAWEEDFAGKPTNFDHTMNDHRYSPVRFEAIDTINDLSWTHSGERPSYSEPRNAFIFLIDSNNQSQQGMSAMIQGPAKLTFPSEYNYGVPYFAEVHLNGQPAHFEDYSNELIVSPGSHEIGWRIAQVPEATITPGAVYPVYAYLPTVQKTANVTLTSENSDTTISPEKESYAIGETINISAPQKDTNENEFAGWRNASNGYWISDEPDFELPVLGDLSLEARYSELPLRISGAITEASTYNEKWIQDEDTKSPTNQASLTTSEDNWLTVRTLKELTLKFKFKTIGSGSELIISRGGEIFRSRGAKDWQEITLHLNAFEIANIDVRTPSDEDKIWLSDFESSNDWSPDILPQGSGNVIFSPPLETATAGDTITASPAPSDEAAFLGWSTALSSPIQRELQFTYGEPISLTPVFDPGFELPFGTAYQNYFNGWTINENQAGGLDLFARYTYQPSDTTTTIRIDIDGPKLLRWEQPYSTKGTHFKLNGAIIEYPQFGYAPDTRSLQIPEGRHTLEVIANFEQNQSVGIEKLTAFPGYKIDDSESKYGSTQYSPQKPAYQIGETVEATAIPINGYLFDSWSSPFAENPISFTFTFDGDAAPKASFKAPARTAEILGLSWTISNGIPNVTSSINYSSEVTGQKLEVKRINSNEPVAMRTQVDGPFVIRIDPDTSTATGIWNILEIDNVRADQSPNRKIRRGAATLIEIPAGKHELSFSQYHSHIDLDSSYVQLHPGYLVDTASPGSTITVEPLLISYPDNTKVKIQTIDLPPGGEIDWQGLPSNATTKADNAEFHVNEGLSIDARYWRQIHLFDMDLHYASDHRWSNADSGGFPGSYSQTTFSLGARSLLKAKSPSPGFFTYSLSSYSTYLEIQEKLNGQTISTYAEDDHFNHTGILRTLAPADEIQIELRETNRSPYWAANEFFLTNFDFQETLVATPYLSWWNKYDKTSGTNQSWTNPKSDIDGDGLNAYIEYLLDLDPFKVDRLLKIAPALGDTKNLRVKRNAMDLSSLDNPEIQYSYSLSGPWSEASTILLENSNESDQDLISFDLLTPPSENQPIFFRLEPNTFTPTIDNLIDL